MCKIASTGEESVGWMCSKDVREQVMKRADALRVEGRRRRGKPRLRWDDCIEIDLVRVGGEWGTRARNSGEWRRVVEMAVKPGSVTEGD